MLSKCLTPHHLMSRENSSAYLLAFVVKTALLEYKYLAQNSITMFKVSHGSQFYTHY